MTRSLLAALAAAALLPAGAQAATTKRLQKDVRNAVKTARRASSDARAALAAVTGLQGRPGATGPQGLPGAQGTQGAVGPQGPRGESGPAGPTGQRGPTGQNGANGTNGTNGAAGPSDGYFNAQTANQTLTTSYAEVTGFDVPPGNYLISGSVTLGNFETLEQFGRCAIGAASSTSAFHSVVIGKNASTPDGEAVATLSIQDGLSFVTPTTRVSLRCRITANNDGSPGPTTAYAEAGQLSAIKVGVLHR